MSRALTIGTAGHIDHGKTALVRALTGVDTDRLPEEKLRGLSIALGYAPLRLPGGQLISLVDVPGHERLIRTMVSGATGIDLFLLAIAADDGVMPQTREHVRILDALGVTRGVIAITKSDLADPLLSAQAARELLPGLEIVPCSVRANEGIDLLAVAVERAAVEAASRSSDELPAVLHVDRVFTVRGAGTVVTGTLWSGVVRRGDRLNILPHALPARVRGIQVHDGDVREARAGQRVALNLAGVATAEVSPGDALVDESAPVRTRYRVEVDLRLRERLKDGERVQVHHGTRSTPARARQQGSRWQLRLERPLLSAPGDRVVLRRLNPPATLGGGVVLEAAERPVLRPPKPLHTEQPALLTPGALALEQRLRAAGHKPPTVTELGDAAVHLPLLRAHRRAVRVGRVMYAHPDAISAVRRTAEHIIKEEGAMSLARLRDELGISRRHALALLEHLDAARITLRREDDSRVLRRPVTIRSP